MVLGLILIEPETPDPNIIVIKILKLFTKKCILKFVRQLRNAGPPARRQETPSWETCSKGSSVALAPKGGKTMVKRRKHKKHRKTKRKAHRKAHRKGHRKAKRKTHKRRKHRRRKSSSAASVMAAVEE
jgi:hypothetical protein